MENIPQVNGDECQEEETVSDIFMSCRKFTQEGQELKHNLQ